MVLAMLPTNSSVTSRGGEEIAPEADECAISFDEILGLHLLQQKFHGPDGSG